MKKPAHDPADDAMRATSRLTKALTWILHHPGSAKKTKRQLHRMDRHATRAMLHQITIG